MLCSPIPFHINFIMFFICVCVCASEHGSEHIYIHAQMACGWSSVDNFQEWALFFHSMVLMDKPLKGLVAGAHLLSPLMRCPILFKFSYIFTGFVLLELIYLLQMSLVSNYKSLLFTCTYTSPSRVLHMFRYFESYGILS